MKLEKGKHYVNREGEIVRIIDHDRQYDDHPWSDEYGATYTSDGFYYDKFTPDDKDLIRVQF